MRKTRELIKAVNELRMQVAELRCKPQFEVGERALLVLDWIGCREVSGRTITITSMEILVTEHDPWPFWGLKEYRAVPVYYFDGTKRAKEWQLQKI